MSESFLKTHHISLANFLTILTEAATGWRCSVRKGALRNFLGKHLSQSLFLNKVAALRPATLLKKDSRTSIFLWVLRNFLEHLFYGTPPGYCFFTHRENLCSTQFSTKTAGWLSRIKRVHMLEKCVSSNSKNKWLLLPGSFTAKCGLVFVLTLENAFRVCSKSKTLRNWLSPSEREFPRDWEI